ncbi:MAG: ribonuclease H-like domain-containing protein [Bryobacteraceae bacterium]|jgi:uncharacterized protein YprB with RNaseH-like and TPR domain
MEDIQEQLAQLRRRMARIDRKWTGREKAGISVRSEAVPLPRLTPEDLPLRIEQLMSGEVVRTAHGEHFETERLWERHRRHGSVDIADLAELPEDLLGPLTAGAAVSPPARWAFLDTETTGLAGGAGTYAFLIGVGSIEPAGFRLRQFFMRDYGEEPSLLWRLAEHLKGFDVLVTYNGKSYDQPLLETRFRMVRAYTGRLRPFDRMEHLDLLFGARRLWKLRLESCRLVELERSVLGVEREGDLPGEMIPYCYFEFLRTREAFGVVPIFHHNAIDILSLACLTAIVPFAFRSPENAPLRHGADLIGLARWLEQAGRREEALRLYRRAVDLGLPDDLLFRALWDIAATEKRLGRHDAAVAAAADLAGSRNPYRVRALEELARHYERRERNYAMALEMTRAALAVEDTPAIRRRERRLVARLERPRTRALPL